ncbi:MAG: hypothetical protein J4F45_03480, partial [Pseudomonadales bacterium]|nr:hypothetical protein [Pseudomonadales bacterium]
GLGVRQRDVVNYVTHGIPSVAVEGQERGASVLDEALEDSTNAAFAKAREDGLRYVSVELLLLALLADTHVDDVLGSVAARKDELRQELGTFTDATSVVAGDDEVPQPTRMFNRIMPARATATGPTPSTRCGRFAGSVTCRWRTISSATGFPARTWQHGSARAYEPSRRQRAANHAFHELTQTSAMHSMRRFVSNDWGRA